MANRRRSTGGGDGIVPWNSLGRRRATAFLVAGGLMLGFVASNGLEAFTSAQPPTWVNVLFVAPSLVAATVGLLGFYPLLTDRTPRLALASAAVVTVAGIAATVLFVVVVLNQVLAGLEFPFLPVYFLTLLSAILGFVLTGVASLRAQAPSRRVGLLVLGPPTVNVLMVATAPMNPPQWSTFLVSAAWTGTVLAIGVALRIESTPIDRGDSSIDSAA